MKTITLIFIGIIISFCSQAKVIHVYVALCDNASQGIVPVPEKLGNGDDAYNNLYWGAYYGTKAFFKRSNQWTMVDCQAVNDTIIERCVFQHKASNTYLVAHAYRGRLIKNCIEDFLKAAAGGELPQLYVEGEELDNGNKERLVAYVGHDGLMEFSIDQLPKAKGQAKRDAIVLACISKSYFEEPIRKTGATPLLWTTGLMAPEAYTLEAAVNAWIVGASSEEVREKAAATYHKYQKCGINGARRLLVTGY